jgi:hypothetical protein
MLQTPIFSVIELWANISQTQYNSSKRSCAFFFSLSSLAHDEQSLHKPYFCTIEWLWELIECFYNVFFPKWKELFSVGSTFSPTRSTCELNHCWRNMSENMTWWNQLPVDRTASHPTIPCRLCQWCDPSSISAPYGNPLWSSSGWT